MPQLRWKPFSLTHVTHPLLDGERHGILQRILPKFLALISLTPPFVVCSLAASTVAHKDVVAAYLLLGCLLCSGACALLKEIIDEPRPYRDDGCTVTNGVVQREDGEVEYGMPSNHSCFGFFCAAFVCLYLTREGGAAWAAASLPSRRAIPPSSSSSIAATPSFVATMYNFLHAGFTAAASLLVAGSCAYSRVYLGYHTASQVIVGSILGVLWGLCWYGLLATSTKVQDSLISLDGALRALERARKRDLIGSKKD